MWKHASVFIAALLAADSAAASAPYGVATRSVIEFERLIKDNTIVAKDIMSASIASRQLDVNSNQSSCFESIVYELSPFEDVLNDASKDAVITSIMKLQYDRDMTIRIALGDLETERSLVRDVRARLSEISGTCAAYGGVIDKIRSMREIVDRTDEALNHFHNRISR